MHMSNFSKTPNLHRADILVRYLTHPQVHIDPEQDVRQWSLNGTGQARVAALAASGALRGTTRIVSSRETKAIETAKPLVTALNCWFEPRKAMHENDRSATGYLPPEQFERVADRFFAHPNKSADGWETARLAQMRILREVHAVLCEHNGGDILLVGHGAVGTLLFCALAGLPIGRAHDQGTGGGGNIFSFRTSQCVPLSGWQPMENLIWSGRYQQVNAQDSDAINSSI